MRLEDYGVRLGATGRSSAGGREPARLKPLLTLAQPLWGMKAGRMVFTRPRPTLHRARACGDTRLDSLTVILLSMPQ